MTNEERAFLSDLTFYHGTSRRTWDERIEGMDGGLYLTTNPSDALNYADEAAIGENYRASEAGEDGDVAEAVVVTLHGTQLLEIIEGTSSRPALILEPDWGWVDGLGSSGKADTSDWRSSLESCACLHLAGFTHGDKEGLILTDYQVFEDTFATANRFVSPTFQRGL